MSGEDFGVVSGMRVSRRLSDATRELAARAIAGEHGRAMEKAAFSIPPEFFLSIPTPNRHYAEAVRLVAERAPLRIIDGEKIVGSATLLEAAFHRVPLTSYGSISHTTLGFDNALRVGYRGLRSKIEARLAG